MSEEALNQETEQPAEAGFLTPAEQETAVAEAEEVVAESPEQASEVHERLAVSMGWNPNGKNEDGISKSAEEFIRDTADINVSLRKRVDRLTDQVDSLVKNSTAQIKRALKEQKERLQREFDDAVESGDKAAAKRASDRISELEREAPADGEDVRAKWAPHAEQFIAGNGKALADPLAKAEAEQLINSLAQQGWSPEDTYNAVERKLRKEYPEHYTNQNRERPSKVQGDSRPSAAAKTKWDKLLKEEPEAESVFKQYVEMGVYKDTKEHREKYAKLALED